MKKTYYIILLIFVFCLFLGQGAFSSTPQYSETTVLVTVVPVFELTFQTSDKGINVLARSSGGREWSLKAEGSGGTFLSYVSKNKEWNNMPKGTEKSLALGQNKYIVISLTE
jgi:hypothetical protein